MKRQTETTTTHIEVHHHPKVEKKGFKEYFFEFLMIFLAGPVAVVTFYINKDVTLG